MKKGTAMARLPTDGPATKAITSALWWLGWRAKVAWAGGLLVTGLFGAWLNSFILGAVPGLIIVTAWFCGTRLINQTWKPLFDSGFKTINAASARKLGLSSGSVESYSLVYNRGSALLVTPARRYAITPLFIGGKFLGVVEGSAYDLVSRVAHLGSATKEMYYQHISSIDYKAPYFQVRTSAGETISFESSQADAGSAVDAVRRRLR